ncbi:MAG: DoxX family membrane protein [Bacteroidota bacterium]
MKNTDFFFLLVRLVLGYIYFSSGINKLADGNFGHLIGPPGLIKEMAAFGFASLGYAVAVSQVVIGLLVMTQRYSLIGLICLVPLSGGILFYTITQSWTGTPFVNAFIFSLVLASLFYEYHTVKVLWSTPISQVQPSKAAQYFPNPILPFGFLVASFVMAYSATFIAPVSLAIMGMGLYLGIAIYICTRPLYAKKLQIATLCFYFLAILMLTSTRLADVFISPAMLVFGIATLLGILSFVGSLFIKPKMEGT